MAAPKGTLLVYNGTDIVPFLPSTDGQTIVFDSNENLGLKWKKANKQSKIIPTMGNLSDSISYARLASFTFPGSDNVDLSFIKVISYMDTSITSYDLRIYDATNNAIISEANFNNIIEQVNDMGILSNLPVSEAIWEVLSKRNGGSGNNKNVYVKEVTMEF